MRRFILDYLLNNWFPDPNRKPLIIRGARQVGKTWVARNFALQAKKQLIEINFEKNPDKASLFNSNNVQDLLLNLSTVFGSKIDPDNCVLFLDEIQEVPDLLAKLRWFAEDLPNLCVIAAGSLLEFILTEHEFSMPVGRITYVHMEPLSFKEFLLASNKDLLCEYISKYQLINKIPQSIHEELDLLFKQYLIIGGLPSAVLSWVEERSLNKIHQIQIDLLSTYKDDFSKYNKRIPTLRLDEILQKTPMLLGQKFVFSKVNKEIQAASIKNALQLLEKSRLIHRVNNTAANGLPLAAEVKDKSFKEIFLDVGLCCVTLGLNYNYISSINEIILINSGALAEQIVGQLLRTIEPPYISPALYYWQRDETGSNAEIDYIIQHGNSIIPIEVKAGTGGTLKSLHLFMHLKKLPLALRINSDYPSITNMSIKHQKTAEINFKLVSIPFYLIEETHRLLNEL